MNTHSLILDCPSIVEKIRQHQWLEHVEVCHRDKAAPRLRTTALIPSGTFVCEYVGEIMTYETHLDRRMTYSTKQKHLYALELSDQLIIDAFRMGNIGRFARPASSANCEFRKWPIDGLPRLCLFTTHTIKAGEELTYDPSSYTSTATNGWVKERPGVDYRRDPIHMEELTPNEKRVVLHSSVFLLRNLRQIKNKRESKDKNNNQHKPSLVDESVPLFFTQNFYHPDANRKGHLANDDSTMTSKGMCSARTRRSHSRSIQISSISSTTMFVAPISLKRAAAQWS